MPEREAKRSSHPFPMFGDVYDVNFDPVVGAEIGKLRPGLVVSNDINNQYSQTVTVLPITSKTALKMYPFQVLLPKGVAGLTVDSRVKANQIRTVDKRRLVSFRGSLPAQYLPLVDTAMKVHLNLK